MARLVRALVLILLVAATLMMLVPIAMRISVAGSIYASIYDIPQSEVAIVPGASVVRGVPSQILASRADAAIALYKAGKVKKILVTGDNGALSHDEVTPVRKYLLNAGVPAADIFLDHAGFDTYSSMYRAKHVFKATSATVVTQDFHLPRSLYIAENLGIDAYGFEADGGSKVYDYVREIPASVKALYDLAVHREPKYLGEPLPLTGDGQTTWY